MSRLGHITTTLPAQKKSWTPLGIAIAATSVLALAAMLINYHPSIPASPEAAAPSDGTTAALDGNDQKLVSQVSQNNPDVGKAYEASLKEVNSYISDAEQAISDDPDDAAAHQHLMDAYEQKAMLYDMATSRSLD